jgi:hypothetical protein
LYFDQIYPLYYLLFLYCPAPLLDNSQCISLYHLQTMYLDIIYYHFFPSSTSPNPLRQSHYYNHVFLSLSLYIYTCVYVYI